MLQYLNIALLLLFAWIHFGQSVAELQNYNQEKEFYQLRGCAPEWNWYLLEVRVTCDRPDYYKE